MSLFKADTLQVLLVDAPGPHRIAECRIDVPQASMNVLSSKVLQDIESAWDEVSKKVDGWIFSSAKDSFIAGADITEFLPLFLKPKEELSQWIGATQALFNKIEDANIPTVSAISGVALGGGMELILSTAFRVAAQGSKFGLPETKLGICPGWGGTVRLPRLVGLDPAIEWITTGNIYSAEAAQKLGVLDAIVPPASLLDAAVSTIQGALAGTWDWKERQARKMRPMVLAKNEVAMIFGLASGYGPFEAPKKAVTLIKKTFTLDRTAALSSEVETFVELAHSDQAKALIGNFLADQAVKRSSKAIKSKGKEIHSAAVLGAGIMGGGIAVQGAMSKVTMVMKDISPDALKKGMAEAAAILEKSVQRGKMSLTQMADSITRITPSLEDRSIAKSEIVIEAVTENEATKIKVLQATEGLIANDAILTSNTSTISITRLGAQLKRPAQFCGMHFFNPVPRMQLVEVIRSKQSSEETIGSVVALALAMGKTPIVVQDCPGFLVNRVLFAYFTAYQGLLLEGGEVASIDQAMTRYGWPMGPATLLDVVGIDTAAHASEVMSQGFPDRMQFDKKMPVAILAKLGRNGAKSGHGFYIHTKDAKGRSSMKLSDDLGALFGVAPKAVDAKVAEMRLMTAFILESMRCLEEKIVNHAHELDLAMLLGLGFPSFRGGPIRYAETLGLDQVLSDAKDLEKTHGPLFSPPKILVELANSKGSFFPGGQK
jgi:3-hydroxyacyl-CoA dehydrogenase / enoyl-CoA hydratase / 3-hydroxybutyryl-CoA epimerase / enoyl-CoA isomerase